MTFALGVLVGAVFVFALIVLAALRLGAFADHTRERSVQEWHRTGFRR